MSDTLVFDMSSASEGSPSVFVRKDWLSILDNMNRNYQGNQCIIDTSQLANSNKYMSYREGYLLVPMVLTGTSTAGLFGVPNANPALAGTQTDFVMGMKNWYGSVIHSFSLDYNGTTIVQQTPFVGMWNCFKLMTSLSLNDLTTQGAMIGFYPDNASSFAYATAVPTLTGGVYVPIASAGTLGGVGICNNSILPVDSLDAVLGTNNGGTFNMGLSKRISYWNWDYQGFQGANWVGIGDTVSNRALYPQTSINNTWKSYIFTQTATVMQVGIVAQVYLKHLHSFFERTPLLKGVFMKLILNLNQTSVNVSAVLTAGPPSSSTLQCTGVNSPLGGVSPIMISSGSIAGGSSALATGDYIFSLAVGQQCINQSQSALAGAIFSPVGGGSVQLVLPAYTFNPVFETSMLSSPIKKIVYEDIYQYTINNVLTNSPFTYLITNGIANVKSVLVLPYYTASTNFVGTTTCPPFQSPFDPAGAGPTSPLCLFSNFNVQVSGQNAIYNTQRYTFEQFSNQLYGQNSVNGGMTDGLTSGLVGKTEFEMEYCYYYVNVGRMLPIEEAVPKAINLIGINQSGFAIDMYVFISYGVEVSIDILSGARV